jgi:glutaminyl-tRNA synthetase
MGHYTTPFSREILIDRSDFMEIPPKKYFRLFPGNEVRLRGAYFITCQEVIKDADGQVIELKCTYDPATKSGAGCERKVKGTIHWVDANHASEVELHLYDYLVEDDAGLTKDNFLERINPKSLTIVKAYLEPELMKAQPYEKFQFIRNGFFSVDPKYSTPDAPVFNQIVSLKSSWKPTN